MAAPVYASAGAGVFTETNPADLTPACPATVNAGDLLILHAHYEGSSVGPNTPTGWTLLDGPRQVGATSGFDRMWVFGKIADGTEASTTISLGSLATANMRAARIYRFTGVAAEPVSIACDGFGFANGTSTTVAPASVTTPANDCLAVAIVSVDDDNPMASFTGESGGDWTEAVAEYADAGPTPDVCLQLQTATMATAGTISGGSVTMVGSDAWGVITFYVRSTPEHVGGVPLLVSAGAGVSTETNPADLAPACPATVTAGDLLILHAHYEGTTVGPVTPAGWSVLDGPRTSGTNFRSWVLGKIADGTEGGTTISLGVLANTNSRHARIYRFTGIADDLTGFVVGGFGYGSGATATINDVDVTTPAANCLAVNLCSIEDDNGFTAFTGESGGNWVKRVAEYMETSIDPDITLGINTAEMVSAGTVGGGSQTMSGADAWGCHGFYIRSVASSLPTGTLGEFVPDIADVPPSTGTVYYVDKDHPAATDSNSGTSANRPWLTVGKAFDTAPANSRVRVKKATTPYSIGDFSIHRGGTADNPITVEAYDYANPPTIEGRITWAGVDASWWVLKHIIADGANTVGNSAVLKCTDTGPDHHALGVGAHDIWFVNVEAKRAKGAGGGWLVTGDSTTRIYWWNCLSHDNDPTQNTTHGWYLNAGNDLHLMNCIAADNGGYGFHINTDNTQIPVNVNLYNCLAISQQLRAGFIVGLESGAPDNVALFPQDIHFYNCISAYHTESDPVNVDRFGFRLRSVSITSYAGFNPVVMRSCLSFGNLDGDIDYNNVAQYDSVRFISGYDPKFTNYASGDYTLLSSSPARHQGYPSYTPLTDFNGYSRSVSGQADLGPFQYGTVAPSYGSPEPPATDYVGREVMTLSGLMGIRL